ncbi:MAG: SDR family NAD(P)-dependent oxidoreductase [Sphingomonas sp.]
MDITSQLGLRAARNNGYVSVKEEGAVQIKGKTAVVTGATDGIGIEIARHLKAEGASVIVVGRDLARLDAARSEGFEPIAADLSTVTGCDALVAALAGQPLDILVNNAGMGADYDVGQPIDLGAVDRCIFLNLNAPIRLITGLLDTLRARPEAMIVNVTSGLAIAPSAGSPVYCGTKAGLRSFTMALRAQLSGTKLHVLEALPPVVETQMTAGNNHKKMPATECGRQIVAAIMRDRTQANIGMTAILNAVHNISPLIARQVMLRY